MDGSSHDSTKSEPAPEVLMAVWDDHVDAVQASTKSEPAPEVVMVKAPPSRAGRIAVVVFPLLPAAVLLPGSHPRGRWLASEDGGWRAWTGTVATIGLLVELVDEIRIVRRRRRAARQRRSEKKTGPSEGTDLPRGGGSASLGGPVR